MASNMRAVKSSADFVTMAQDVGRSSATTGWQRRTLNAGGGDQFHKKRGPAR
jgi:hypothetical protein